MPPQQETAPAFDPNEKFAPAFDPNEFAQPATEPAAKSFDPNTASDLERLAMGMGPKQAEPEWWHPDYWAPTAIRAGTGIAGGVLGATAGSIVPGAGTLGGMALGGGYGGVLGETLAQTYEQARGLRQDPNWWQIGTQGLIGAVPGFGKAPAAGATARELIKYGGRQALEGAALGAGSTIPTQLAETGELPSLGQVGAAAGIGGVTGGVVGGGMAAYGARPKGLQSVGASQVGAPPPPAGFDLPLNPQRAAPIDPNFNQGVGDAELAGSQPYKQSPGAPPFETPAAPGTPAAKLEAQQTGQQPSSINLTLRSDEPSLAIPPAGPGAEAPMPVRPPNMVEPIAGGRGGEIAPSMPASQGLVEPPPGQVAPSNAVGIPEPIGPSGGPLSRDIAGELDWIQQQRAGQPPPEAGPAPVTFMRPSTGESGIPAAQAKPGDVPEIPEPQVAAPPEQPGRFNPATLTNLQRTVPGAPPAAPARRSRGGMNLSGATSDLPAAPQGAAAPMPVRNPIDIFNSLPPDQQTMVNNLMAQGMSPEDALNAIQKNAATGASLVSVTPAPAAQSNAPVTPAAPPDVVGRNAPVAATQSTTKLPKDLAGLKSRFNIGTNFYIPQFADDLDKALYAIANPGKKSKRDADYLKWVMDQTGLDEASARALGRQVKAVVKTAVQGPDVKSGPVKIPSVGFRLMQQAGELSGPQRTANSLAAASKAQAAEAKAAKGGGGGMEPPNKPPTGGEPPEPGPYGGPNPEADKVAASLKERLDKAIDEAGTPNALAPEEISKAIDELSDILEKMPNAPAKDGVIRSVLAANKALLTSWDASAPGRQGKAFIFNKSWWTSLDDMVRAWGSPQAAKMIDDSITDHSSGYFKPGMDPNTGNPTKTFAQRVGLDLATSEEVFRSKAFENFQKYSGISKASRAHTAFLNKLRSDQFVSMMEAAKRAGFDPEGKDIHLAKRYAEFINSGTGRGSLNLTDKRWRLGKVTGELNDVFFAPKNMVGQIRTWNNVLNPYRYATADPVLRKQALTSLFAIAGTGLLTGEIARQVGAKVSNDPFDTEFRKIRIGDMIIDPFGGYQQFPVAAMKLASGAYNAISGGRGGRRTPFNVATMKDITETFFTNRLSPVASFIWAWMDNKEFDGKPFDEKRALFERTAPIAEKDIFELMQEDPFIGAVLSPFVLGGLVGGSVYPQRKPQRLEGQ
jgi:hypothetical protein